MAKETYEQELARHNAAFEKVKPKDNWKMPINAIIDKPTATERKEITDAVIYFCGCVPEFITLPNNKVRVVAQGYYNAVGA